MWLGISREGNEGVTKEELTTADKANTRSKLHDITARYWEQTPQYFSGQELRRRELEGETRDDGSEDYIGIKTIRNS